MRTAKIQEKFDNAFKKLDMMECDGPIRTQAKVTLNSIYYMIQGSIAAANNSAIATANKLYTQADMMLNNFIRTFHDLIDMFFVGRIASYGKESIAAIQITFPITFMYIALAMGLGIAGTALISQLYGNNQIKEAKTNKVQSKPMSDNPFCFSTVGLVLIR